MAGSLFVEVEETGTRFVAAASAGRMAWVLEDRQRGCQSVGR